MVNHILNIVHTLESMLVAIYKMTELECMLGISESKANHGSFNLAFRMKCFDTCAFLVFL